MKRKFALLPLALVIVNGFSIFGNLATEVAMAAPMIAECEVFPDNNYWNTDVSNYSVHPNSESYINYILNSGGNDTLHPDFGGNGAYGIPYITVDNSEPKVPINFTAYGDESDPGPYPIPQSAPVEGGDDSDGDRHVLVVNTDECKLYELYRSFPNGTGWDADSGVIWDLNINDVHPDGWTSADAAGLPILPGLARFDEVESGAMNHALRFTVSQTQRAYIYPATHYASSITDPSAPPMGLRLRLKADFDTSTFTGQSKTILETLKKYGMIVADNGSNWFITGAADTGWDDEDLNQLKTVPGSAFEAIDISPMIPGQDTIYRFWSETLGAHFYTQSVVSRDEVLARWPDIWAYEGPKYKAEIYNLSTLTCEEGTPIHQFWSEELQVHFYAESDDVRDDVLEQWPEIWDYEKVAFCAYQTQEEGALPVHRFWSDSLQAHFYTISDEDKTKVETTWPDVWDYEGPKFYAYAL